MAEQENQEQEIKYEALFNAEDMVDGAKGQEYIIRMLVGKMGTITIGRVTNVVQAGVNPVATVDITPMVLQVDGSGKTLEPAVIYNVPYFRYQGGENAVIIDPEIGDIGLLLVASRDISGVKSSKNSAPPNSARQYDVSDSIYLGGILNGAPKQYIHFLKQGINIVSTGVINAKGTKIILDAPVETTSTIKAAGNITDMTGAGNSETMQLMRDQYNGHTHIAIGLGAPTSPPDIQQKG